MKIEIFSLGSKFVYKTEKDVLKKVGPLYMHVEVFDGVHVLGIAVKDVHINNDNNINSLREKLSKVLEKSISVFDVLFWQKYIISVREISLT